MTSDTYLGKAVAIIVLCAFSAVAMLSASWNAPILMHGGKVTAVAFGCDNSYLFSSGVDGSIKQWDIRRSKLIATYNLSRFGVWTIAVASKGKLLAAADVEIRIWDYSGKRMAKSLLGHDGLVNSVAFSPDGSVLVSASRDGSIKCWDTRTSKEVFSVKNSLGSVTAVIFIGAMQVAAGYADGVIKIYDVTKAEQLFDLRKHEKPIIALSSSRDYKRLASVCREGRLSIWDSSSGKLLVSRSLKTRNIAALMFGSDDATIVFGDSEGKLSFYDPFSNKVLSVLNAHSGAVRSIALSPDGNKIGSGGDDGKVVISDYPNLRE